MHIIFNSSQNEINRERRGYLSAFRRNSRCSVDVVEGRISLSQIKEIDNIDDAVLLYPDPPYSELPDELQLYPLRTACFQIDTFSKPNWRALWSSLFDVVFTFHPNFSPYFERYGHKKTYLLPHAIERELYFENNQIRKFDIGWVGSLDGSGYKTRRRLLPQLAALYSMNDWSSLLPETEVPSVYRQSRIVVNISRDDYPTDANLRCFESMASGALLLTQLPSELETLGFLQGRDFVGYKTDADLFCAVKHYTENHWEREQIANSGRAKVLAEHTYDVRAEFILECLKVTNTKFAAPARKWDQGQVDSVYCHYFCKRVQLSSAIGYFGRSLQNCPLAGPKLMPHICRCVYYSIIRGFN